MTDLSVLNAEVVECRRCPRLVEWREEVARTKRAAYADDDYWGRPVPSFGDPDARILIVGLAPGAHGANRTGRMFTGDRSGEWLYGALHSAGLANRAESVWRDDGLALTGTWLTAAVRCVPPGNKPSAAERQTCRPYLKREIRLLTEMRTIVTLGGIAWDATLRTLRDLGYAVPTPKPKFGHGTEVKIGRNLTLIGSYHPSQQNTFTGRLTREMFDAVWERAVAVSHRIIGEMFSSGVATPGVSTTEDLRYYYWQRVADLGLDVSFSPSVSIRGRSPENREKYGPSDRGIRPGDILHCDVGLKYLHYNM